MAKSRESAPFVRHLITEDGPDAASTNRSTAALTLRDSASRPAGGRRGRGQGAGLNCIDRTAAGGTKMERLRDRCAPRRRQDRFQWSRRFGSAAKCPCGVRCKTFSSTRAINVASQVAASRPHSRHAWASVRRMQGISRNSAVINERTSTSIQAVPYQLSVRTIGERI